MKLISIICLFVSFNVAAARADVLENHVKPTLIDGFDKTGLILIGSGIAATLLTQTVDYDVRARFSNYQVVNNSASRVGDFLGRGYVGAAIALSQLYWDRSAGVAHVEALTATFLATSLLKVANGRTRPSSDNRESMPSGHTSTTFATATSLTYQYGLKAALPAYTLAVFTAATRWSDDAHWFSDTVAGALVGFFWGRATAFHHLPVTPVVSSSAVGAVFNFDF